MDADLLDQIRSAMSSPASTDTEIAHLDRIDAHVREALSVVPLHDTRRRHHRLFAPLVAAAILASIAAVAVASGGVPSWLNPSGSASKIKAFQQPQVNHGEMLRAFMRPKSRTDNMHAYMLGAIQNNLKETTPSVRLLGPSYYRELFDWTDQQHRHLQIVAIPTNTGGVCVFRSIHSNGPNGVGDGMAGCTVKLDATHPVGAVGSGSTGHDLDVSGVMDDDVTAVAVVQRNGTVSPARLGTNAFWWTAHSPWTEQQHMVKFPRFVDVTTRDGVTRRFTLEGVPIKQALAKARAVKRSRNAKCKAWGARALKLGVCGYRSNGTRLTSH